MVWTLRSAPQQLAPPRHFYEYKTVMECTEQCEELRNIHCLAAAMQMTSAQLAAPVCHTLLLTPSTPQPMPSVNCSSSPLLLCSACTARGCHSAACKQCLLDSSILAMVLLHSAGLAAYLQRLRSKFSHHIGSSAAKGCNRSTLGWLVLLCVLHLLQSWWHTAGRAQSRQSTIAVTGRDRQSGRQSNWHILKEVPHQLLM